MKNRAGVQLENQAVIFWFHWLSWAAATFGPPSRTTATVTRTATIRQFNLVNLNEIRMMTGKRPPKFWKTTYYKMSGQLQRLKSGQAELLKTFEISCWCEWSLSPEQNTVRRTSLSVLPRDLALTRVKRTTRATPEANVFGEFQCRQWTKVCGKKKTLKWLVKKQQIWKNWTVSQQNC